MSKHILNSIILLMLFIIILGGGYYFVQQKYNSKIVNLKKSEEKNTARYLALFNNQKELPEKFNQLEQMKYDLQNYPILLMKPENIQNVYSYFEKFDPRGDFFNFKYKVNNIKNEASLIKVDYNLNGNGNFLKLQNFVNYIEYSPPLFFINNMKFKQNKQEDMGSIEISLTGVFSKNTPDDLDTDVFTVKHFTDYERFSNPFRPLVLWNLPPNINNLPDVRYNKLLALTKNTAYFKSVNGEINSVNIGDNVYLGKLSSIDEQKGHAIFVMNYGGIYEKLIRKLDENDENVK